MPPYIELNEINNTITDIITYPLTADYYFYAKILAGIYFIIGAVLFIEENERTGRSNYLSAMAISSFICIILAFAGSVAGIITAKIFVIVLVLGGLQLGIWFMTKQQGQ
jgi:hypothetical protein